jgi:phage terminase large subunit-like protein
MSAFHEYFTAVYDGTIKSCEKMKRVAELLLEQAASPDEYHLDLDIANKHIEFIERFCKVPAGNVGVPLKFEPFQRARWEAVLGFVDDNNIRQYNEVFIVEGRKNGKTTEAAAIELDLCMNDGEGAPEIYNLATKYEQAMKGWTAANNMRLQSPQIRAHLKKRAADLFCDLNMGTIKALASNVKDLDSLDAHVAIIDELGAMVKRKIYDDMKQSMSARQQPLLISITTMGFVRNGVFDSQYEYSEKLLEGRLSQKNKRFLPLIYELDNMDEWRDEEAWIKATPGLGTIKKYSFLKETVEKAVDDPAFRPTVLTKDFNVKQNAASAFLKYESIINDIQCPPLTEFRYGIGSLDAADSVDLNAARVMFMRPNDDHIYTRSMYWIPESVIDEVYRDGNEKERDDAPYRLWIQQGYMRTYEGNRVNKRVMLDWLIEFQETEDIYIYQIGYDPWHIDDSLLLMFEQEFGRGVMTPVRQGVFTLSQPMKNMKADMEAGLIVHDNNPVDVWCLMNLHAKTDINGNVQPVKSTDRRQRIDGAVTLINGYVILENNKDEYLSII